VEHDVDHDVEHDVDHDTGGVPAWMGSLQAIGVGDAPLTMVLLVLTGSFGFLGWLINSVVVGWVPTYTIWALIPVLAVALLAGGWFTKRTALFISRALPSFSSTATPLKRLVGRRGRVSSAHVDQAYGQVKVRDPGGTLITVFAMVDPGKPSIACDTEVYLVEYDPVKKVFVVVPAD
jgi:membrane protein implicated in regulation of membrane protease activity